MPTDATGDQLIGMVCHFEFCAMHQCLASTLNNEPKRRNLKADWAWQTFQPLDTYAPFSPVTDQF